MDYRTSPLLSIEEKAHYAWLAGDTATEVLIVEAMGERMDEELASELSNYGIDSKADFVKFANLSDDAQTVTDATQSLLDSATDALKQIAATLTSSAYAPMGKRKAHAVGTAIFSLLSDLDDGRTDLRNFERALDELFEVTAK